MKEGLLFENDELIYYVNGQPKHAGAIKVDGAIYYIGSKGRAVKGKHIVHAEMGNGVLKRGTYTFGEDYKLVKGSYRKPKRRKRNSKILKFFHIKKQPKEIKYFLISLVAVLAILIFGAVFVALKPDSSDSQPTVPVSGYSVVLPSSDSVYYLCSSPAQQAYNHKITPEQLAAYGDPYRPLVFAYDLNGFSGELFLCEDSSMQNARQYTLPADQKQISIDNLKTGTTYYYTVLSNAQTYTGSFRTAQSNRFVRIPGVDNTRDIGGYQTLNGKTIKQGLLIRGQEIDGLVEYSYYLPDSSIAEVLDTFGFVYDFDLRGTPHQEAGLSHLGESVGHDFYAIQPYKSAFTESGKAALRKAFEDLANPDLYPMYLHCTHGVDRAGTLVFLLQGVLNVSEEDMLLEYYLSGISAGQIFDDGHIDVVIAKLQEYEGDTIQEKIVTFLTEDVGITHSQLNAIRSIFLEDR